MGDGRIILGIAALSIMAVVGTALPPPQPEAVPAPVHIPSPNLTLASQPEPIRPIEEEPEDIFIPLDIPLDVTLQEYVVECCAESEPEVPAEIVIAIIEHESGFQADAVGCNADGTQDYGLMQINDRAIPKLREDLGIGTAEALLDPRTNIRAGVHILELHTSVFPNSVESVLMAYQYGAAGARDKLSAGITGTGFSREIRTRAEELREGKNWRNGTE